MQKKFHGVIVFLKLIQVTSLFSEKNWVLFLFWRFFVGNCCFFLSNFWKIFIENVLHSCHDSFIPTSYWHTAYDEWWWNSSRPSSMQSFCISRLQIAKFKKHHFRISYADEQKTFLFSVHISILCSVIVCCCFADNLTALTQFVKENPCGKLSLGGL